MTWGRGTKEGTGTILNVIFFLGVLVLLQYLSYRHPHEWDFTRNKSFSLSPLSSVVLFDLKNNVDLWTFAYTEDQQTRDLVHQYETASPKIKTHFVDPRSQPAKARELGVNGPPPLIIAKYGTAQEQISQPDEEKLTNAINRLTSGKARVIYFVEGHGEVDPTLAAPGGYSKFRDALIAENYTVKNLTGFKETKIPDDAAALIEIDPKYPPLPKEKELLQNYINAGGRIFFLCGVDTAKEWIDFLKTLGFQIGNDLVMDSAISVLGGGPEFLATNLFAPHPITQPFLGGKLAAPILLPLTRSVSSVTPSPKDINISPLITTSPQGRALTIKLEGRKIIPESKTPSKTGVIPVAEALTLSKNPDKPGRMVVVGSSSFAGNQWFGNSATPNKDFALNAVSWLSESQNTLSIRPKSSLGTPLFLDQSALLRLFLLSFIILPLFGITMGVFTWLRRSRA